MANLVEDLQSKYATEVANLNLQPFVEGMKLANDNVRMALAMRDTEQSAEVFGALKKRRAETDEAYQSLIRRIYAYAEIEGAADYAAFIDDVNRYIRHFKQEVLKDHFPAFSPREGEEYDQVAGRADSRVRKRTWAKRKVDVVFGAYS